MRTVVARSLVALPVRDKFRIRLIAGVGFAGFPEARAALEHFLEGTGADRSVDISELFRQEPNVGAAVCLGVRKGIRQDTCRGVVAVPQWAYRSSNWMYALGAIRVRWRRVGDRVDVSFRDRYSWTPDEERLTQGLHQSAHRLLAQGAREYDHVGPRHRLSVDEVLAMDPPDRVRAEKMYCM